ncbi:MAG: reverse transcriptase domain-containing protein, partial [Pseudomonadota bacterium]
MRPPETQHFNLFTSYVLAYFRFLCYAYPASISCLSSLLFNVAVSCHDDSVASGHCHSANVAIARDKNFPALSSSGILEDSNTKKKGVPDVASLNAMYCNVRSLVPKSHVLQSYISLYDPSIIALTETWLDDSVPSSLFCPSNYYAYRHDRITRRGGGCLILVKDNISSHSLTVYPILTYNDSHTRIDAVACALSFSDGRKLGILCIYRPPDSLVETNFIMIDTIKKFLNFGFDCNLIVGDFNFPDITWSISAASAQSKIFLNFCQENFLIQHVNAPTRNTSQSILDLVFTTLGTNISKVNICEEFGSSDHYILNFSTYMHVSRSKRFRLTRNLKNVDWAHFQELLNPPDDWFQSLATKDIDHVWTKLLTSLNVALDNVAPLHSVSVRNFISSPKIRTALRHKRRYFKNFRRYPTLHNCIIYEKSKFLLQYLLDTDLASRENHVINSRDKKTFWSYVNKRMFKDSTIKSIKHGDADTNDQIIIANAFNDYFVSIYSSTPISPQTVLTSQLGSDSSYLSNISLTIDDVMTIFCNLPTKSSVDADGFSYKILKNGGFPLCLRLFHLFSLSLEVSCIPTSWKSALVTPIFKTGNKMDVRNFRPISVTSCCSRMLERIVKNKLSEYLLCHNVINESQHGFVGGKSTDTLLMHFYDFVTESVDDNRVVDCVFFDFSKAFDTVHHEILLHRLHGVGIRGAILKWLADFLSNRSQRVKINQTLSDNLPVTSGVIQGSVLGPTLFNIFINNIDEIIRHSKILKYADDVRVFQSANKDNTSLQDMQRLVQEDIDSIFNWSKSSGLTLNTSKCFSVSFGRSNFTRLYTIDDKVIPCKSTFSDLGVAVRLPFSFRPHIDEIVSKAFSRLGLINKIFKNKTTNSMLNLFKAFVRPKLEYASIVWNPYQINSVNSLERVQRRLCRMIPTIRHL